MREKRKKIWIDSFQTHLAIRLTLYFGLYQAAVWSLVTLDRAITHGVEMLLGSTTLSLYISIFCIATVVFMGLLFIRDALLVSHRIVGPLYRLRKTINAITAGEELDLVRLRQGDYLQELKDEFNDMLRVLEQRGAVTLKTNEAKLERKQPVPA